MLLVAVELEAVVLVGVVENQAPDDGEDSLKGYLLPEDEIGRDSGVWKVVVDGWDYEVGQE